MKALAQTISTFDQRIISTQNEIKGIKELLEEHITLIQKHGTLSQQTQDRLTVRLPTTEPGDFDNLEKVFETANEGVKNHFVSGPIFNYHFQYNMVIFIFNNNNMLHASFLLM